MFAALWAAWMMRSVVVSLSNKAAWVCWAREREKVVFPDAGNPQTM